MKSKKENEEKKVDLGNVFDRIFKENGERMFTPFVRKRYGFEVKKSVPLKEKIPKTLEREVDFLYRITTEENEDHILHIEFQVSNDKYMIYRMQEYHALLLRKYKMRILHMVLYFGAEKCKMITQLPEEHIFRGFELVCINEIDAEEFLNSEESEMVLLSLLGKYQNEQTGEILNSTFTKLEELSKDQKIPSRYINQLLLLSKLRKLDESITQKIKTMPIFTEAMIKDHALYKEGKEDGIEQEKEKAKKKEQLLKEKAEKKEQLLKEKAEKKEQLLKEKAELLKEKAEKKEQLLKENLLPYTFNLEKLWKVL